MIITITIIIGIVFSLLTTLIATVISKLRFFQWAMEIWSKYSTKKVTKDKRGIRRVKKVRLDISRARARLIILFIIELVIFAVMYTLLYLTIVLLPFGSAFIKIPFGIPFLTFQAEDGSLVTHILFIAFIAFMQPSYLFIRLLRLKFE
ncbi:MAG: hypothetical protein J7K21_02910 [Desulfurococcales archaeon]|nr:hypothetical protein [Desulfurococcales archaeon]